MILESVAEHLALSGVGEVGKSVFVHFMPHSVKSGIILVSSDSGFSVDPELKNYYRDIFKFVVRAESISEGNNIMRAVLPVMDVEGVTINELTFNFIRPLTLPLPYPRDDSGGYEISCVMEFSCYYQ